MLTENQHEILGDRIAALYQELENDVIADIARRVKKTGRFTETAELMAKAMRDTGKSPAEIRKEVMKLLQADPEYRKAVANNTKQHKRNMIHRIRQIEKKAAELGDTLIAEAGDMSFNKDLWLWHQAGKTLTKDSAFTRMVEEMAAMTAGELKNLTRTTGFKGLHGYVSIQNAYNNALDKALIKMVSGAFSFDRAAEDCVRELAHSGLRRIDYASGKSYQLDTAARMCLRTGSAQLSARISMYNCDKTGTDLVEVDAHWGARPEHAEWQGKVYSRSGKHDKYPDFAVCRYGEVDGLCGVNCRHSFYPFFEGISEPNKWEPEPEPKEYNGRTYDYYEATQKQRQMERDIRATKREIEAAKILGGDASVLEAKKRRQIVEYHNFSKAMDIRAKDNRLRVVKGSTDITKTKVYKNQNSLVRSQNSDIMDSRNMANGMRKSPFLTLDDKQIEDIKKHAKALGIPDSVLSFNTGTQTGFVDGSRTIHVRGDILPDTDSNHNRDLLSQRAVLAHEYYGHYMNDPSQFRVGDWRDEFRASYMAAINAPNLSDEERRMLMLDAYDRAREAGVSVRYNEKARKIVYGY